MIVKHRCFAVCIILLVFSLVGCGFQLRGPVALSSDLSPVYIQKNNAYELAREVKALLRSSEIQIVEQENLASVVINLQEKKTRRVISVNSDGRASEYLLIYSVAVRFLGAAIKSAPQGVNPGDIDKGVTDSISLTRSLIFDPDTVLAAANESATLYRDMKRDAAQRILLKLQALSSAREPDSQAGSSEPVTAKQP